MAQPAVSVLVTTYRHARFVEESLDSLRSQTCQDFETIITDDASDDGTPDLIAGWLSRTGYRAHFIRNPVNRGICANRNAALAIAQGRFICSLSGDDAYQPERIERQLACFGKEPRETAAVYSDMMRVDADGKDLGQSYLQFMLRDLPRPEGDIFRKLLLGDQFLPSPAVMVRREAFDAVGLYDESLYFEDLYMWLKLSHRFRIRYLPGCLVRYRELASSMSRSPATRAAMIESTFRALSRWLGQCGDADEALRERLWLFAMRLIATGDDVPARRMMRVIARARGKWRRRAAAALTAAPGGCDLVRRLTPLYLRAKHVAGVGPAPRRTSSEACD